MTFAFIVFFVFFFFKQKTAYEMRISDWSSDVCSSDLAQQAEQHQCRHVPGQPGREVGTRAVFDHALDLACHGLLDERAETGEMIGLQRRSEERRGGKECVRTCRSRWSPYT